MYQAIDVVTEKMSQHLQTKSSSPIGLILMLYLASVGFFFVGLYLGMRQMSREDDSI